MATKTQIGAVIGIEGAREYSAQMKDIITVTKNLASQTKVVESAFDGEAKSINDLNKLKIALNGQIQGVSDKLAIQRAQLSAALDGYHKAGEGAEEMKNTLYDLATETNDTEAELYELENRLKQLPSSAKLVTNAWKEATNQWGELFKGVGTTLTKYVTTPLVGVATVGVKTFSDFESAFTGVRKTVNATEDELLALEEELSKIPLRTGSSYEDVMKIAEAGGQLGIEADGIAKFTENVVMLADSTNILGEEGAVDIAKFMNIMGDSTDTIDMFGSSLVALGNTEATDEQAILSLSTRLASAGKLIGLTTPEVLGLSAAMSSVGLTAEAGGTAMSTTMSLISKAVATNSEDLQLFGEITGQTAEEFAEKWRSSPIEALQEFLVGLTNLEGGSEELLLMLDELGFSGIRQSDMLRRLTLNYDGVSRAVKTATDNYITNEEALDGSNALTDEATKRYATFAVQVSQLKESFRQFTAEVGSVFIPLIQPVIEKLSTWMQKFKDLDEGTKRIIVTIGALVAALGPALVIGGNILIFAAKLKAAIGALSLATKLATLGTTLSTVGTAIVTFLSGPVGLIIVGIAGVVLALRNLGLSWEDVGKVIVDTLETVWHTIEIVIEVIKSIFYGVITGIITAFKTMIQNAYIWFQQSLENTRILISTVLNVIVGIVTAVTKLLQGDVKGAFSTIFETIKYAMSNVGTVIRNSLDTIKNMFGNIISAAWNWGKDLIGNLVDGIKSKISAVTDAASSIAKKISSYIHFSEPDVGALSDFHTWMPDMMKGLAQGIDSNLYLVDNAISRVADTLGMGNSVNYGGVVINLNVPVGANGQQLVDEIETELANRTIRRKAVFG